MTELVQSFVKLFSVIDLDHPGFDNSGDSSQLS